MSIGDVVEAHCSKGHRFLYEYRGGPLRSVCPAHLTSGFGRQVKPRIQRGLGGAHQKRRAALLPLAWGTQCPLPYCGHAIMERGDQLDLDHSVPRALGNAGLGDRIVHRRCNQIAGSKLGRVLRARRRAVKNQQVGSVW